MTKGELLEAHAKLSPILKSLAIAWRLKAEDEKAEAEGSMSRGMSQKHTKLMNKFASMAKYADEGILCLTKAELDEPESVPFLPEGLIEMATVTGRLKTAD